MDRQIKRIAMLVCVLCCLAAMPLAASAASIYDGNISTTQITIFRDIAAKLPIGSDYVFFRSGQYEYLMVAGDLAWDGSMFTGQNLTQYILTSEGNYNSTYSYGSVKINDFTLAIGDSLVYSNLGDFPDLYERNDYHGSAAIFALAILCASNLLRPIFDFVLRFRQKEES